MNDVTPGGSCALCGRSSDRADLVCGRRLAVCRSCVARGLAETLASVRGTTDGDTLPRGYVDCAFCEKRSPASAVFRTDSADTAPRICTSCLDEAYALLTRQLELAARRRLSFPQAEDGLAASLLSAHFDGLAASDIVTSSRVFPGYLRADLQRALDRVVASRSARCVGLHGTYGYETITYASLGDTSRERVVVAPLRFEDVDIGEAAPVRCMRTALWLVTEGASKHAVLLTPAHEHGQRLGWHVEVAVPAGVAGEALTRAYFEELEESVQASASYRGKVLSLECVPSYRGMAAGNIVVHKLSPVARGEIILPESTLALLERNLFGFAAQRPRLRELGMPLKKGLLFYGPPGTGKTHTIRYLAAALPDHTTLLVTAEQVAALDAYMALARLLSPAIVVIEDVDLIARSREDLATPGQESLLNGLLNEMDGLRENAEITFILTTNRPEALETALAGRPGRVDQAVEFPLPDEAGRRKLIDLYRRDLQLAPALGDATVQRTEGVSAAFLKELMRRTAQVVLERDAAARLATEQDVDVALRELLFEGGRLNAQLLGVKV